MTVESIEVIRPIFQESISALQRFMSEGLQPVVTAATVIGKALGENRKVLAFGNGGSASDAEHLIAELVGRFECERRSLPGIALTADSSVVTAISNDYGYENVFRRQIDGLGMPGDIAFGISTSGRSANVEQALAAAKTRHMITIALTGRDGGRMGADADIHLNVPVESTPRIQEVHRTILHAICTLIDREIRRGS